MVELDAGGYVTLGDRSQAASDPRVFAAGTVRVFTLDSAVLGVVPLGARGDGARFPTEIYTRGCH
jgi:hypothetical protein